MTMATIEVNGGSINTAGAIVRQWRQLRNKSQMDLALDINVSTRHLSFVETGRAQAGRDLLLSIAEALGLPLRQRNALLLAAGYAPEYAVTTLDAAQMAVVTEALRRILAQHEPFPALVCDAAYDIVLTNQGFEQAMTLLVGAETLGKYRNIYRLTFAEDGLRPYIEDWPAFERMMLARLLGEAISTQNPALKGLYADLAPPNLQVEHGHTHLQSSLPVVNLTLCKGPFRASFFSTITTFGAPLDVTTQELRIESLFPADAETRQIFISGNDEPLPNPPR
jgi:transcriptional regulator with XRE-family HTH domain